MIIERRLFHIDLNNGVLLLSAAVCNAVQCDCRSFCEQLNESSRVQLPMVLFVVL